MIGVRSRTDGNGRSIERWFYLEVGHLVVVWESPHGSQDVHTGKTHAQHVIAEAKIRRVGVGTDGSLSLLHKRGSGGVRAELGGHSGVSGVGVDGEGWGRIQSTSETVGRIWVELALGQVRLGPVAVVGESVAIVSTVASVVRAEGVWRPTGFFGIGTTCGIHRPLESEKRVGEMEDAIKRKTGHKRERTFIISMSNP